VQKRDWIWVAIRVFGIYLLVLAVTGLPGLVSSAWSAVAFADIAGNWRHEGDQCSSDGALMLSKMFGKLFSAAVSSLLASITQVVIFTIVGIYLLRSGKLVFRLVYPPDGGADDIEPPGPE